MDSIKIESLRENTSGEDTEFIGRWLAGSHYICTVTLKMLLGKLASLFICSSDERYILSQKVRSGKVPFGMSMDDVANTNHQSN